MHMVLYVQEVEKQYKQHVAEGGASDELRFSYAVYLIKSDLKNDIRKGIRLMESDISQGKDQRDHFYFIAMGHYKLEVVRIHIRTCINT
ncbi:Mitochondrial fission 1 protein [Geodia barretti]|uniref:Mitochondrial fission 1 protein n=1 Tax=Geodia barretti TaxID=519541 RepID=A0AA35S7A5_GEOBA|nr:Mitochondrial fission 1 protein [Geodia barretti]